jgi:hypothetical protein
MTENFQGLSDLRAAVAAIASAGTPSEIFRALLEGGACGAPRTTVLLLRERRWKGWGGSGHGAAALAALRSLALPDDHPWLARLAASEEPWLPARPGDDLPRFGQAPAEAAFGVSVRVGGKAVAALMAERGPGEGPWQPEALALLVDAARLRLELDLAWRRLRAAGPALTEAPLEPRVPAEETDRSAVATQMSPWTDAPSRPAAEPDPGAEEVRRFARLVATDIRLYNEEAVVHGRQQRDLAQRLGEQLHRGRESFVQRFPELGEDGLRILRDSYVQVLAGGDESLIPAD